MDANDHVNDSSWTDEKLSALEPGSGWQPDTAGALERLRARRVARASQSRRWMAAAAVVTAMVVTVPAFSVTRAFAARCVEACVDVTTRVGQLFKPAQPQLAGDASKWLDTPALRPAAPEVTLTDAKGAAIALSSLRGQVVLVNFWATWCPPCKVEIPWFTEFQTTYRDRGLTLIGVSADDDGWTSVKPFAEAAAINYTLALGNDDVAGAFGGIGALPATFLIDRQGRIAAKHVGIVAKTEYESELARLVAEPVIRFTPAAN